jgi:Uma2 family endonuclease
MAVPQKKPFISPEEYLRLERAANYKSEYLGGEIFAMAGGSANHSVIAANTIRELGNRLGGKECLPYTSDLRIRISATGLYTYPDVSVVCGSRKYADEGDDTIVNPALNVEVLSDSTEAYDRGTKFAHYRRIPSLREYVLISQSRPTVEVFSRQTDGTWLLTPVSGLDSAVRLPALDVEIRLGEIFLGVEFPEQPPLKPTVT